MNNITQKFTKFIILFSYFLLLNACATTSTNDNQPNQPITEVAILMPLSGTNGATGRQYAGLIKMGLADGAKIPIKVTSYDSSDQEKLKNSINKILEKKPAIIIGPVFSQETKTLAANLKQHNSNIVVLTLSNDPTLAESNVFVFGHAPMRQIEQITDHLLNCGYKNYITLLPIGRHSQTIGKILQNMITGKGGTLDKMELYATSQDDMAKSLKIVSDIVDNLNEQEENFKQPVIILSDDLENLKKLYMVAKNFNIDKKAVIAGDNRLDIESGKNFDIIYTGSIKIDNARLKQRVAQTGIDSFSFMHALAYDAGKMIATYIGKNYSRDNFLTKLTSEKFSGLSGKIYFIDSIAQRKYNIIRKQNGSYRVQAKGSDNFVD